MQGIRLADWRAACRQQRAEGVDKRAARAEERAEARDSLWENAALIVRSAGVEPRQYTLEEVDRMARGAAIRQRADLTTGLSTEFFPTAPFRDFQARVFTVLEEREARLKAGFMEQKGAALLGPAGTGKSRMADKVIMNFQAVAGATGGREFGDRIVSVIVPGRATVTPCGRSCASWDIPAMLERRPR